MTFEDIQVEDHFVDNDAIGSMHTVVFEPPTKSTRHMIMPNSLAGNILTPDGFGIPYLLAKSGIRVVYVEFPGSGHSTMPEDSYLRRDYLRHGVTALGDAVGESLLSADKLMPIPGDYVMLGGFSLGAIRAATLLPSFGTRSEALVSADSAGFGSDVSLRNARRYRSHLASSAEYMNIQGESVEGFFATALPALEVYRETSYEELKYRRVGKLVTGIELRGIFDSMNDITLENLRKRLAVITSEEDSFELRAGFVSRTYTLNKPVVNEANQSFDEFERTAKENDIDFKIGLVQGGWYGQWHDQAIHPDRFMRLIQEPISQMQNRLDHVYMP